MMTTTNNLCVFILEEFVHMYVPASAMSVILFDNTKGPPSNYNISYIPPIIIIFDELY